jgi:hypothetical protein
VHLVGFTIEIYYDARSYKHQIYYDARSYKCQIYYDARSYKHQIYYDARSYKHQISLEYSVKPTSMLSHSVTWRESKAALATLHTIGTEHCSILGKLTHTEIQMQFTESGRKKNNSCYESWMSSQRCELRSSGI